MSVGNHSTPTSPPPLPNIYNRCNINGPIKAGNLNKMGIRELVAGPSVVNCPPAQFFFQVGGRDEDADFGSQDGLRGGR